MFEILSAGLRNAPRKFGNDFSKDFDAQKYFCYFCKSNKRARKILACRK
jgi:hypothetical protein